MSFSIKFWGVRGSIACPSPRHVVFGGNTSCVEVLAGDEHIILDAGTGIRSLGHDYVARDVRQAYLLLSHTHWDHINGFPFFKPAFHPHRSFRVMAGHLYDDGGVKAVFAGHMAHPTFPIPLETMSANLDFVDFVAGESFQLGPDVKVLTTALNHPSGATAYRIEHAGRAFCYVTDTEHIPGHPDANVLGLIKGADLVAYDCSYTDAEFPSRVGWGHSTWQEGVRLCQAADAKRLAIFHHDPDHEDDFMNQVERDARDMWSGAFVARETMQIKIV